MNIFGRFQIRTQLGLLLATFTVGLFALIARLRASTTRDVTANMEEVSRTASFTGAASDQVLGSATGLLAQADQPAAAVSNFLAGIRAA